MSCDKQLHLKQHVSNSTRTHTHTHTCRYRLLSDACTRTLWLVNTFEHIWTDTWQGNREGQRLTLTDFTRQCQQSMSNVYVYDAPLYSTSSSFFSHGERTFKDMQRAPNIPTYPTNNKENEKVNELKEEKRWDWRGDNYVYGCITA